MICSVRTLRKGWNQNLLLLSSSFTSRREKQSVYDVNYPPLCTDRAGFDFERNFTFLFSVEALSSHVRVWVCYFSSFHQVSFIFVLRWFDSLFPWLMPCIVYAIYRIHHWIFINCPKTAKFVRSKPRNTFI